MVNPDPFGDGGYYGDEQAAATGMRASYGDSPFAGMAGLGAFGSGAYQGLNNMFGQIGGAIRPVTYMAPARVNAGYYGQYVQETGFVRGLTGILGLNDPAKGGVNAYDYNMMSASDFGQRVADTASSLAIFGTSIAAGYNMSGLGGSVGRFFGSSLGPLGAKLGGGLGSFMAPLVATQAAEYLVHQMAQRNQLSNYLEASSFRFIGAGSPIADPRRQSGMNYKARLEATDFIRSLDASDPTMSTDDLSQILQESTRLGLLSNIGGMDDFKKKFKDITENVKVVSRFLHTTLKDGLETIKQLKSIGVDVSEAGGFSVQASTLGRLAGRTGLEMFGVGLQGAEMFRGTGIDMRIGYQSNMMNLAQIRAARDAGFLSQEALAQAGGEEAFAQRRTASSLQYAQTAAGRGFNAAFFSAGGGASGFNAGAFREALSDPNASFSDLVMQAARNLGTPKDVLTYQANQEKMLSQLGGTYGGMGLQLDRMKQIQVTAKYYADMTGTPIEVAYRAIAKRQFGMSDMDVDADMADLKDPESLLKRKQAALSADRVRAQVDKAYRNNIFTYAYDRFGDFVRRGADLVARPVTEASAEVREAITVFAEENVLGIERARAGVGVDVSRVIPREEQRRYRDELHDTNVDLSNGVFFKQADALMQAKKRGLVSFQEEDVDSFGSLERNPNLKGRIYLGGGKAVSKEEYGKAENQFLRLGISEARMKELNKEIKVSQLPARVVADLSEKVRKNEAGTRDIVQAVTGKPLEEASEKDIATTIKTIEASGSGILKERLMDDVGSARNYTSSNQLMDVKQAKALDESISESVRKINIGDRLDGFNFQMTADELATLAEAERETDPKRKDELRAKVELSVSNRTKGVGTALMVNGSPTFVASKDIVSTVASSEAFKARSAALLGDYYKKERQVIEIGKREAGADGARDVDAMSQAIDQGAAKTLESISGHKAFQSLSDESRSRIVSLVGENRVGEAKEVAANAYYKNFAPSGDMASSPSIIGSNPGQSNSAEEENLRTQARINQEVYGLLHALAQGMRIKN